MAYKPGMAPVQETECPPAMGILGRCLERGRVAHAYLFTGDSTPELEGLARLLTKALNCTSPHARPSVTLGACGQCSSCRRIDRFNHPDILWIRPESKLRTITIDQIRDVLHAINLKPTEGLWKVAIIVAAERMNTQAANAFLKTLEEPPPRSLLILLSGEPQRLLETIRSRCLRLAVQPSADRRIVPEDRQWLLRFSAAAAAPQKSLMNRYLLLDGLLTRLSAIRADVERDLSAKSPLETYDEADSGLREQWEDELNAAVEAEYRRQRSELLDALHGWLRDVWLARTTPGSELWYMPELADAAKALAQRLSSPHALENLKILERTRRLLETNVQEALALEVGLLKLNL